MGRVKNKFHAKLSPYQDIEGSPLSNFVELLAKISRSAETISNLCVVNTPAT